MDAQTKDVARLLEAAMTPGTPEHEELGDAMEAALAELDEGLPPLTDWNLFHMRMTW